MITTAIQGSRVKGTIVRRSIVDVPARRSAFTWAVMEFTGVVIYKVSTAIGHAIAEVLMGRMP